MFINTHTYIFVILGEGKGGGREIPFECYSPVWKNKEGKQNIFSFHQNRKERGNGVGSRSIDIMDACQSKEIVPFHPKLGNCEGRAIWRCEQGRLHPLLPTWHGNMRGHGKALGNRSPQLCVLSESCLSCTSTEM